MDQHHFKTVTPVHIAVSRAHVASIRDGIDVGGLYSVAKKYRKGRMTNEEITNLVLTRRIGNKIKEYIQYLALHGLNERKMMNVDDDEQHDEAYINVQDSSNVLEMGGLDIAC
ncbi:hypothetical protein AVEN_142074-1 [Araneus ventricosus]|uniref:Uncharacterized protein n=1 Tax=Araneus ventricosus TaxID=182803 RepID=A0A4Y2M5N3_ARAVE|nr:hypothetical protein AVEN_142074-1 [Araneus ventricosus]